MCQFPRPHKTRFAQPGCASDAAAAPRTDRLQEGDDAEAIRTYLRRPRSCRQSGDAGAHGLSASPSEGAVVSACEDAPSFAAAKAQDARCGRVGEKAHSAVAAQPHAQEARGDWHGYAAGPSEGAVVSAFEGAPTFAAASSHDARCGRVGEKAHNADTAQPHAQEARGDWHGQSTCSSEGAVVSACEDAPGFAAASSHDS